MNVILVLINVKIACILTFISRIGTTAASFTANINMVIQHFACYTVCN